MPTIVWKATRTTLTGGRSVGGNLPESLHARARVVEGKQRQEARQRNPVADLVAVVPAAEMDRRTLLCFIQPLEGRELGRLFTATERAAQSPTTICTGAASAATVSGTTSATRCNDHGGHVAMRTRTRRR